MPLRPIAWIAILGAVASCHDAAPPPRTGPGSGSAGPPARVVVVGPSTTANLHAAGLTERLVGVSDFCTVEAAAGVPRVGGLADPNLERVAALRPDLVIQQGAPGRLGEYCAREGIRFRSFTTDTLEEWRAEMRWIDATFGDAGRAAEVLATVDARLREVAREAERRLAAPGRERPRVLIVASRRADEASGLLVAGGAGFLSELVHAAGGRNLFAGNPRAYFPLNEETLVRADPEVILELRPVDAPTAAEALATWRRTWPGLDAVEHGRVLVLDDPEVLMPCAAMARTAERLSAELAALDGG